MSIEIHISVPDDLVLNGHADMYVARQMAALGFTRVSAVSVEAAPNFVRDPIPHVVTGDMESLAAEVPAPAGDGVTDDTAAMQALGSEAEAAMRAGDAPAETNDDARLVGKPGGDKKRRNSDEKAEDDEFETLAAQVGFDVAKVNGAIEKGGRTATLAELRALADKIAAEEAAQPAIRENPEARVNPEDAAQDAADEAKGAPAENPHSPEKLRSLMAQYAQAQTMEAAQEDGPKILNDALGTPPEGAAAWKLSLVDTPELLEKAIAAWTGALAAGERYSN